MGQEKFCLKWNDFQSTVSGSFGRLREEPDFVDVTLVSDDEVQIPAHRLVLSASSSFFKTILRKNIHSHPLVYLSGVTSANLGFILDYIYLGEVQIYQEQLDDFLDIAQKLRIEGLISSDTRNDEQKEYKYLSPSPVCNDANSIKNQKDTNQEVPPLVQKDVAKLDLSLASDIGEIDRKLEELTDRVNGAWTCKVCGKTSKRKRDLGWHIETHIEGLSFPCGDCDKIFRSRNSLLIHGKRYHQ